MKPFDPGDINVDYYLWRPVLERVTTLTEMRQNWNLVDLANCHEVLDIKAESESHYVQEAERLSKNVSKTGMRR